MTLSSFGITVCVTCNQSQFSLVALEPVTKPGGIIMGMLTLLLAYSSDDLNVQDYDM